MASHGFTDQKEPAQSVLVPVANIEMPQSLLENPDKRTKDQIIDCFFGRTEEGNPHPDLELYFDYYKREISRLRAGVSPQLSTLAAKTHVHLLHIREVLSQQRCRQRSEIRKDLQVYFQTKDHRAVDRSIDLTIRLWLMINVRDSALAIWTPEQPRLQWDDNWSLEKFINSQLRSSSTILSYRDSRLDPSFTVANMIRMCDLQVRWTEYIDDHLRLDRRRKVLSVFPLKSFLVGQLDMAVVDRDGNKYVVNTFTQISDY